jgi:hypothetical protein
VSLGRGALASAGCSLAPVTSRRGPQVFFPRLALGRDRRAHYRIRRHGCWPGDLGMVVATSNCINRSPDALDLVRACSPFIRCPHQASKKERESREGGRVRCRSGVAKKLVCGASPDSAATLRYPLLDHLSWSGFGARRWVAARCEEGNWGPPLVGKSPPTAWCRESCPSLSSPPVIHFP